MKFPSQTAGPITARVRARHGHSDSTCWPQAPSATKACPCCPCPLPCGAGHREHSMVVALRGLQSCDTAPSVLAGPWLGRLVGATTRKMPPAPCHRTQAPSLPPASCHPAQPRSCCCPAPASRTQLHVPSRACCRWDAGCGVGGLQADTGRGHPLPVLPADCSGDTATPVPCSPAGQVCSPPKPAEIPLLSRGVGAGGRGRMRCGLPVPAGMGRDPHRPDRASSASGEGEQRTRTIRLTWQFLDLR